MFLGKKHYNWNFSFKYTNIKPRRLGLKNLTKPADSKSDDDFGFRLNEDEVDIEFKLKANLIKTWFLIFFHLKWPIFDVLRIKINLFLIKMLKFVKISWLND